MSRTVGIDLGTTNSVVSTIIGGGPEVIANSEGGRTTPSVVAFARDGEVLVGEVAKRQAITNPDRTVRSVKRHMGTNWSIDIDAKTYTAQEVSARILQKLKRDAETDLGETVTDAVITVPAYFDDAQRTATKEAGQIAGLNVLRIINEPTAAALAYGLENQEGDETVLVFDLGGGTFDVSVLSLGDGVFEVLSTHGDTELFTTADDNQPSVEVHVLQGEREMSAGNKTLGKFQLVDLPPAPRGTPQIEVTFDIDANGIVNVSARDQGTGKQQSITITGQSTLSEDDINKMVADAEAHAADDKRRRDEAEARNGAETVVYQTEKVLTDNSSDIAADDRAAVEARLADLKSTLERTDADADTIRAATDALMSASQAFTQRLYEHASAAAEATGTGAPSGSADDDIVDAEIVDEPSDSGAA